MGWTAIFGLANKLAGLLSSLVSWLERRELVNQGRTQERAEQQQELTDLLQEGERINAKPFAGKSGVLGRMRDDK